MAKGLSLISCFKTLPLLLLFGVPVFALIAFSGAQFFWVQEAYDGWRIFQIFLLIIFGIYAVFIRNQPSILPHDTSRTFTIALPIIFSMIVLSVWQSEHSARAAADAALYALLAISIWAQADLFRKNPSLAPHIGAWLAVLPLFAVFSLLTGISQAIDGNITYDWHKPFANIRMLNDALLPCLFLLWQRPAWLATNYFKNTLLDKGITSAIYLTSTAYILILWYDGARAALLSILVGLGFIALFRRDYWSKLRLPLVTILSSWLLFFALQYLVPEFFANTVLRTDSSGRIELWLKTVQLWQENPILGVGGNNFVTSNPWALNGHPHNIPLQWISEWGVAGLIALLLLIPFATQLFKHRQILPVFVLGAAVAVGLDATLSGVLVYPLSQMLGLWLFAWLIALLPTDQPKSSVSAQRHHFVHTSPKASFMSFRPILKVITVIAIMTILTVHGRDMICTNCMSTDNNNAPRFWQYGRALHLVPIGSEAINLAPDALLKNR